MIHYTYLLLLLAAVGCLAATDWYWKLVFWNQRPGSAAYAAKLIFGGIIFFIAWDLINIHFYTFFFPGTSPFATGIMLAPQLPLEEVTFFILLLYQTLIVWEATR